MTKSGSWAVVTCLRCSSHSGGPPRLAQAARLERRGPVRHPGPSEGVLTSHHPKRGLALRVLVGVVALGWLSWAPWASPSCVRGAGTRESHFGGRDRTSCSRIRCSEAQTRFGASERGTRSPDIDSRPLKAVFVWIQVQSCTIPPNCRAPFPAPRPPDLGEALRPDQACGRNAQS